MAKPRDVNFSARARKDFEGLENRIKTRVADGVRELADNPLVGKKLKGELSDFRSYRLGSYRVIYRFTPEVVEIALIEHRKDVYR